MKAFRLISSFTQKWLQSWRTKPDFLIKKKSLVTTQISKKFSFLNAFISGAVGVRTLLSILVGIAGITSIAVYDTIVNTESPMFVSNAETSDSETGNKDLLAELAYLLSSQPEIEVETENTVIAVEPVTENIAVTDDNAVFEPDVVFIEPSPETGGNDITALFVLLGVSSISAAVLSKLKKKNINEP